MNFTLCRACKLAFPPPKGTTSYASYRMHCSHKHDNKMEREEAVMVDEVPDDFQVVIRGEYHSKEEGLRMLQAEQVVPVPQQTPADASTVATPKEVTPAGKPPPPPAPTPAVATGTQPPPPPLGSTVEWPQPNNAWRAPDPSGKLRAILVALTAPERTVEAIIRGFVTLAHVRAHPANLDAFLRVHFPKDMYSQIPIVVNEMMPFLGPDQTTLQPQGHYPYPDPRTGNPPAGYYAPQPTPYTYPYNPYPNQPYNPYPWSQPPGQPATPVADPVMKALQDQIASLTKTMEEQQRQREQEKRDEEERRREERHKEDLRQIGDQFKALEGKLTQLAEVKASEQAQQRESGLLVEVKALRDHLDDLTRQSQDEALGRLAADNRELRARLDAQGKQIEGLRETPVGRTVEDLVSDVATPLLEKVDGIGQGVKEELAGWREKMTTGSLPQLGSMAQIPPGGPQGGGPRTEEALRVAGLKEAEDEVLKARGGQVAP